MPLDGEGRQDSDRRRCLADPGLFKLFPKSPPSPNPRPVGRVCLGLTFIGGSRPSGRLGAVINDDDDEFCDEFMG